ncbi:MAG: glycosyltransferase [Clostridia bacterium]|nr:glycosyltransferase [Clostridia bacterium]
MKVSVICGAYNAASCYSFDRSIRSILTQSHSDLELIICDDGSTDDTWERLCEYANGDERIKLLRNEENKGLAYSLNRCIELAEGDLIARHDCDDYSAQDRLEKQMDYLMSHPDISLLGTQVYLFDENGVWGKERFPLSVENKDFLFVSPYQHGAVMFRREALLRAGGYRVAKETRRAEDYDLFMTMQTFSRGANMEEYLYYFCEDKSSRKRRKYRYRIDEVRVRLRGFKRLSLMPKGFFYAIKPLIVGLIPSPILEGLKKKRKRREEIKNDE